MITIWTDVLRELPVEQALEWIAAAGFDGVEFGVSHDKALVAAEGDGLARARHLGELAVRLGVPAVQMHAPMVNFCSPDEPEAVAAVAGAIRRAAALGVRWLVVHPGCDPAAGSSRKTFLAVRDANVRAFEQLLAEAERHGVGLAVENMTTYSSRPAYPKMDVRFGQSAADLLWLLEKIDSPLLGVCWDTGHANTQQIDQAVALREIGSRVKALHLNDNDGTADSHWAPLRGTVRWARVFSALRDAGYAGPLNFELSGERRFPIPLRRRVLALVRDLADHLVELGGAAEEQARTA